MLDLMTSVLPKLPMESDITPNDDGLPGIAQLRNIVGVVMTIGLILSVLALIISAIVWGFGANSSNPHLTGRSKVVGVLLSSGIQRSFSLICTPMRSDQAVRDIRKKKVEHISDQAQRAKIGQIEDTAQTAEYHDILQQADLTAGHGILRYTGLITITATTIEDLNAHVAALEQAAIQANCETRLLAGQQAQAFTAAALPLCRQVQLQSI